MTAASLDTMAQVALIIPAYEPDRRLVSLVDEVSHSWTGPIIVVNDGSSAPCAAVFDAVRSYDGLTVLQHERNRGKGAALKTALRWIREHCDGTLGAVTADADGQHAVEDILHVADTLRANSGSLVMGCRDFSGDEVPGRSYAGNNTMRIALRLVCGVKVSDTQTGLRGIPVCLIDDLLRIKDDGYQFETTMLIDAHRLKVPIVEVPIRTIYIEENSSSHYRTVRDSLKIVAVFLRYAASSMASSVVDLTVFTVLQLLFESRTDPAASIIAATALARAVSAVVNYTINQNLVFSVRGHALRYALLVVGVMAASATLVSFFSAITGLLPTVVKIPVDFALFFVNYAIQRAWVYTGPRK